MPKPRAPNGQGPSPPAKRLEQGGMSASSTRASALAGSGRNRSSLSGILFFSGSPKALPVPGVNLFGVGDGPPPTRPV
jgi:hypothetical protein